MLLLGTIVNIMFSSADVICVLLADKVTELIRNSAIGARLAQRLGGVILMGLGVNLVLTRQ